MRAVPFKQCTINSRRDVRERSIKEMWKTNRELVPDKSPRAHISRVTWRTILHTQTPPLFSHSPAPLPWQREKGSEHRRRRAVKVETVTLGESVWMDATGRRVAYGAFLSIQ